MADSSRSAGGVFLDSLGFAAGITAGFLLPFALLFAGAWALEKIESRRSADVR